jgi:tRNA(adenine34) deaminase
MQTDEQRPDTFFMRAALDEAARATAIGEVPIAALVVRNGAILAQSHNCRETWQDPTAHAEMIVIRAAAKALGSWRLTDTTLYVTLEPCAMCLGAVILARIPRIVFGARDPKAGACGSVLDFTHEPRLNHRIEMLGGLLEEESQILLQQFFRQLRTG